MSELVRWLNDRAIAWLTREVPGDGQPLSDFTRMRLELRKGDVLLIEGRSRIAEVIRIITHSAWSHAALYIGRTHEIENPDLRAAIEYHYDGSPDDQLIIEALMGRGTIISPLGEYRSMHTRICRPVGLLPSDAERVIGHAVKHLGWDYDLRQVLDLARFFFPWGILPRRWRSSLFQHNAGGPTRTVCSTLLAESFSTVDFPILPFIVRDADGSVRFFKRNPRLFAPRDFDYSPYFAIIKYPYVGVQDLGLYHRLPWSTDRHYNDENEVRAAAPPSAASQSRHQPAGVAALADVQKTPATQVWRDRIPMFRRRG